jgi:hypothetical protein
MPSEFPLTYEEFLDNYEFKVAKRMLLREYPWIKDVFFRNPEEVKKYNLIFLDVTFDPFELGEQEGWRLASYVITNVQRGDDFWSPYLSTYFRTNTDDARALVQEIDKSLEGIHSSPAIPKEMKLPEHRKLNIGTWHIPQGLQVPTDYVDWHGELE